MVVNDKKESFVGGQASSPYNIDPALLLRWTEKKGNINVFYNLLGLILNITAKRKLERLQFSTSSAFVKI